MKTQNRLSWNDIVFEFKNKDYGAFFLRKIYNRDITIAASIGLLVLLLLVGPPFIMAKFSSGGNTEITNDGPSEFTPYNPTDYPPPPPPPPPPPDPEPEINKLAEFVVKDTVGIDVDIKTVEEMMDSTKIKKVIEEDLTFVKPPDDIIAPPEVPVFLPEMPVFKGGETEMQKFIRDNFVYPRISKEIGVQGKVHISFIVNEDGTLSGFKIERGLDEYIDEECIRVIKMMPPWEPGRQNGNPAKVRIFIPIVCTLVD